jgi:hypothetical protein
MSAWWIIADMTEKDRSTLLLWLGILLGSVIVGFGLILVLRKMLKDPVSKETSDPGFSLSDLRDMRDRGEITPQEYEQTRALVIAKVKAAAAREEEKRGGQMDGIPPG